MERTHVAEDPQIEKAVREEEAQLERKNAVKNMRNSQNAFALSKRSSSREAGGASRKDRFHHGQFPLL